MNIRFDNIARAFSLLLITIVASSCGKSKQQLLLGTWQTMDNDPAVIVFYEDGTFKMTIDKAVVNGMDPVNGKWVFLDDGRLKIDASAYGTALSKVVQLGFTGDEMVFTDSDGANYHHKRVKYILSNNGLQAIGDKSPQPER